MPDAVLVHLESKQEDEARSVSACSASMFCAIRAPVFLCMVAPRSWHYWWNFSLSVPSRCVRAHGNRIRAARCTNNVCRLPHLKLKLWKSVSGVCTSPGAAPSGVRGLPLPSLLVLLQSCAVLPAP